MPQIAQDAPDTDEQHVDLEFVKRLDAAGYQNILILPMESAEEVNTPKRRELIHVLREHQVSSIRDLARRVDRDPSAVHHDLRILFKHGVIDYEQEHGRKIPRIGPDHIFVEPLL